MSKVHCEGCGEDAPSYEITHYSTADGKSRQLCSRCFNAEMAKVSGVEGFDNTRLQPIGIADCTGEMHLFHFVTRLLGNMVTLEAFEVRDGQSTGYQVQIIGDPEEDMFALLGRMVERIRKALSVKHINDAGDGHGFQIIDLTVRAKIECGNSEDDDYAPCFVIDGKEVSLQEFGHMLSSFEGWQFKLEIFDRSEDV
jgi:acid stress-induced BolA-like protein IbaG/YrbA